MKKQKNKSTLWIVLITLLILAACVFASASTYQNFPKLPGALEENIDLDNLKQVLVPGSTDIHFDKKGAYAVYYEKHSVYKGEKFTSPEAPPNLDCFLTAKTTGDEITAVPDIGEKDTYFNKDKERVGYRIMSISISDPGDYTFACQYQDGKSHPPVVLAVGPNFAWEFINIFVRSGVSILAGVGILLIAFLGVIVLVAALLINRSQKKQPMSKGEV